MSRAASVKFVSSLSIKGFTPLGNCGWSVSLDVISVYPRCEETCHYWYLPGFLTRLSEFQTEGAAPAPQLAPEAVQPKPRSS